MRWGINVYCQFLLSVVYCLSKISIVYLPTWPSSSHWQQREEKQINVTNNSRPSWFWLKLRQTPRLGLEPSLSKYVYCLFFYCLLSIVSGLYHVGEPGYYLCFLIRLLSTVYCLLSTVSWFWLKLRQTPHLGLEPSLSKYVSTHSATDVACTNFGRKELQIYPLCLISMIKEESLSKLVKIKMKPLPVSFSLTSKEVWETTHIGTLHPQTEAQNSEKNSSVCVNYV